MLAIDLKVDGDIRAIPRIKAGRILKLAGENGIGKTMAATLLEIACGNYRFKNERRFKALSGAIDYVEITAVLPDGNTLRVVMKPQLWSYDKTEKKISSETIGKFILDEKEISYDEFNQIITVRVIRGDETLSKQIELVGEIFNEKITERQEKLQDLARKLTQYLEQFTLSSRKDDIDLYEQKQQEFSKNSKNEEELKTKLDSLREQITGVNKAIELIPKLIAKQDHNIDSLNEQKLKIENELNVCEKKIEELSLQIVDYQNRIRAAEQSADEEITALLEERERLSDQLERHQVTLKENLISTGSEDIDILAYSKIEEAINKQIETIQIANEQIKQALSYKDTQLAVVSLVERLSDTGKDAMIRNIHEKVALRGDISIGSLELTFEDIYNLSVNRLTELKDSSEFAALKDKVELLSNDLENHKKRFEILKGIKNVSKKLEKIEKKLEGKGDTLESVTGKPLIGLWLTRIDKARKAKSDFTGKKTELHFQLEQIKSIIEMVSNLPSANELRQELQNVGITVDFSSDLPAVLEEMELRKEDLKKRIAIRENELSQIKKKIQECNKEIESLQARIQEKANEKGYVHPILWIQHVKEHYQGLEDLINLVDRLNSTLRAINSDMSLILRSGKAKDAEIMNIIKDTFQRIFLETYDKPEYFQHVFTAYKKIIDFDIINKAILFENDSGAQEFRSLDDFSSGEKAYAFMRAMMSISPNGGRHRMIILDESNALLDYIRDGALLEFQRQLIESKGSSKIINILPVKENLKEIIQEKKKTLKNAQIASDKDTIQKIKDELKKLDALHDELEENGYYQEIILN